MRQSRNPWFNAFTSLLFIGLCGLSLLASARPAGHPDPDFNAGDTGFGNGDGLNVTGQVYNAIRQPDGKQVIVGSFTSFNGVSRANIARLNADGSVDSTFNPGTGTNNPVNAALVMPDGKVVVGGSFTTFNGTAVGPVVRLNADGSRDTGFNAGPTVAGTIVGSLALQGDQLVIGGRFASWSGVTMGNIARLNGSGSLDTSFTRGAGIVGSSPMVRSLVVQPDGKVLVGGTFDSYNGTNKYGILRLQADGSLDTGFGGIGVNRYEDVRRIVRQADGKILIGGAFTGYNALTAMHVARLDANGALDTGFSSGSGAGGHPAGSSGSSSVLDLFLQSDGKVLVSGDFPLFNGVTANRLVRLNQNGSLDSSFNAGWPGVNCSCAPFTVGRLMDRGNDKVAIAGYFTSYNGFPKKNYAGLNADGSLDSRYNPGTGAGGTINVLAVQPDGKTVIGGSFTSYAGVAVNRIARINKDGTMDAAFNDVGALGTVRGIAIQRDGGIVIGGEFTAFNQVARNRIVRLKPDGTVDTSFNVGTGADGYVMSVALQDDGKILIGGYFTAFNGVPRNRIARLHANGALDTSFDPGTGFDNNVFSLAVTGTGQVIAGGDFTSLNGVARNRIARLNADGSVDSSFNPGSAANSTVYAVLSQADGKVVAGGAFTAFNGSAANRIVRLNTDGSVDAGFVTGSGMDNTVRALLPQDGQKVLVAGAFTAYNGVAGARMLRLNNDGTRDNGFLVGTGADNVVYALGLQGKNRIMLGGDFTSINAIGRNRIACVRNDGSVCLSGANGKVNKTLAHKNKKVIIGGAFTQVGGMTRNRIARLDDVGEVDTAFNPGNGANDIVHSAVLQADGKLLVGGAFTAFDGAGRNRLVRLHDDGSVDSGFAIGAGANDAVHALDLQTDGKAVIAGAFTAYNGVTRNRLARVNSDGTLDTGFDPGAGADGLVNAVKVQSSGKILIGGAFTHINGVARAAVARLNSDGTLDSSFDAADPDAAVKTIAVQEDGKVLIGGDFTSVDASSRRHVARLQTDGTLDNSFDAGSGPDKSVDDAVLQDDGKVVIAGDFDQVNGNGRSKLARLNADGSVDAGFDPGEGADKRIASAAVQDDGKILIGGEFSSYAGVGENNVARVLAEPDSDDDGTPDSTDNCPVVANEDQLDTDLDGIGNACDNDDDNDGVPDLSDAFPVDALESVDTDADGIGNNADIDDDNDGVPDYIDADSLSAAVHNERSLLLNGQYKGALLQERQSRL